MVVKNNILVYNWDFIISRYLKIDIVVYGWYYKIICVLYMYYKMVLVMNYG